MAATVKSDREAGILELTAIDADYDYKTSKPLGWPTNPKWHSIQFISTAADEVLIVHEKVAGGPSIVHLKLQNAYDQRILPLYGKRLNPYIDTADCTFAGTEKVILMLSDDQTKETR